MNQFQLALKHSIEQNEDMVQAAANNLLRSAAQGEEWAIVELARQVSLLELPKGNIEILKEQQRLSKLLTPIKANENKISFWPQFP